MCFHPKWKDEFTGRSRQQIQSDIVELEDLLNRLKAMERCHKLQDHHQIQPIALQRQIEPGMDFGAS
jgi:hypothetical protein